jgi:predicted dehydrogenase
MNIKVKTRHPAWPATRRGLKTTKWGIIGPGRIAHKFAQGLAVIPDAQLFAVASRSEDRARDFARQYNIPYFYGGYEKIVQNPDIDIIYVATPHTYHYENTLMCLQNDIPVLCEKPFTITREQLLKLVITSRERKIFLMEAIWTRFLPTIKKVIDIRESGKLGKIKAIYADFGFKAPVDFNGRLYNPELGGGALLDIGIYPVFLSLLLLGKPEEIKSMAVIAETGVDESCSILFKYSNRVMASLNCTITAETPIEAVIIFENGRIRINRGWFAPSSLTIITAKEKKREINFRYNGNGYHFEAIEAMRCLRKGFTECPVLPLNFSLELMELLDEIRKQCGIRYPGIDK